MAMTLEDVQKSLDELTAKHEELQGQVHKAQEERDVEKARADRADLIIKLSAEERTFFDELPTEKQDDFLKADADARKAMVAKASQAPAIPDEVQKRLDKAETEAADLRKRFAESEEIRKTEAAQKRADADFGNLPGTTVEKGAMLRSLEALPEEARKSIEGLLAKADEAFAKATAPVGSDLSKVSSNEEKANALAKKLQDENSGMSFSKALTEVYAKHPELYDEASAA